MYKLRILPVQDPDGSASRSAHSLYASERSVTSHSVVAAATRHTSAEVHCAWTYRPGVPKVLLCWVTRCRSAVIWYPTQGDCGQADGTCVCRKATESLGCVSVTGRSWSSTQSAGKYSTQSTISQHKRCSNIDYGARICTEYSRLQKQRLSKRAYINQECIQNLRLTL